MSFPVSAVRKDFPVLSRLVNGKSLVYLDNAATSQKPRAMVEAVRKFYEQDNANIHRGVHRLSQDATVLYENARGTMQKHIHAVSAHEVIFTKGTTESINLVASSFGKRFIEQGDEIVITEMEHHSNILPWQLLCEEKGALLKVIPVNDAGELLMEEVQKMITPKTRLVAVTQVSNTLGTINPVKEIVKLAHERGAVVLIDGAQAIPHMPVDVSDLDCDFYCFSGHKACGPTGIGVLYGKEKWLNEMPPYQVGGGTIKTVTFARTHYAEIPLKFEAGTPPIAEAIGMAAGIDYINNLGIEKIGAYEQELLAYASEKLSSVAGLKIIGTARQKAGVLSFVIDGMHPLDIGTLLDQLGIAVRTGHHCTQPLMDRFGIPGTVRASFAFYNTMDEVNQLAEGVKKAVRMLV